MNKKFSKILPHAMAGDHESLEDIFRLYMPLIERSSIIDGCFDEDCKQYILIKIVSQIGNFRL